MFCRYLSVGPFSDFLQQTAFQGLVFCRYHIENHAILGIGLPHTVKYVFPGVGVQDQISPKQVLKFFNALLLKQLLTVPQHR